MKLFVLGLTLLFCGTTGHAQTAEDSVKTVINRMFTAMRTADTSLLRSCFADSMVLQTIGRDKAGNTVVRNEAPGDFIGVISKEQPGNADEQIRFETIKIDGPMAMAWTPYNFFYKGNFSHCGVNSFQLVRFSGTWKIQYIIDTRRRQGCEPGK